MLDNIAHSIWYLAAYMCKITKQFTLDFTGTAGSSLPQEHAGLKHFDGRFLFHFVIYFLKVNFDVSFCIFAATLYSAVKKIEKMCQTQVYRAMHLIMVLELGNDNKNDSKSYIFI